MHRSAAPAPDRRQHHVPDQPADRPAVQRGRSPEHTPDSPMDPACAPRCDWCGSPAPIIWVHGHGQCAACGTNREPCCQPDT